MKSLILACALLAALLALLPAPARAWGDSPAASASSPSASSSPLASSSSLAGYELVEVDAYDEAELRGEPCPTGCTNHGMCTQDGQCMCYDGWSGKDCSKRSCPAACSLHGSCVNGECKCKPGWSGYDCSYRGCPEDCNGHGLCHITPYASHCTCFPGFIGPTCALPDPSYGTGCPEDCNDRGLCKDGKCHCQPGFVGASCNQRECPHACSGRGLCDPATGQCHCLDALKFSGSYCQTLNCPNNCYGNGVCLESGVCKCNPGFFGRDCAPENCPENCNYPSQGRCVLAAPQRTNPLDPASPLADRRGVCECGPFFTGPSCNQRRCPLDCSMHGDCDAKTLTCQCRDGWVGEACNLKPCAAQCVHGACLNGQCQCEPDFTGDACDTPKTCPGNCAGHGVCRGGQCYCDPGFEGVDCTRAVGAPVPRTLRRSLDGNLLPTGQATCTPPCAEGKGLCVVSPATQLPTCVCAAGYGGVGCASIVAQGPLLQPGATSEADSAAATAAATAAAAAAGAADGKSVFLSVEEVNEKALAVDPTEATKKLKAAAAAAAAAGGATAATTASNETKSSETSNKTAVTAATAAAPVANASSTSNSNSSSSNNASSAASASVSVTKNATSTNTTTAAAANVTKTTLNSTVPLAIPFAAGEVPVKSAQSALRSCDPACSLHGRCILLDYARGPECFCLPGYAGPTCALQLMPSSSAAGAGPVKPASVAAAEAAALAAKVKAAGGNAVAAAMAAAKLPIADPSPATTKPTSASTAGAAGAGAGAGATGASLIEEAAYYDEEALWESEADQTEDEMLLRALDQIVRV